MSSLQDLTEKRNELLAEFRACERYLKVELRATNWAPLETLDDDIRSTIEIALSERTQIEADIYNVENEMMDYYEQEDFLK